MDRNPALFSSIEADIKSLSASYLQEKNTRDETLDLATKLADNYWPDFGQLQYEEKEALSNKLSEWLDFEMQISDPMSVEEPLSLFLITLQFSIYLSQGVFVVVAIQFARTMLETGFGLLHHSPSKWSLVQEVNNQLNYVEKIAQTNRYDDVLSTVNDLRKKLSLAIKTFK